MFKKILFPTDLTEEMYQILPFVKTMADIFESEIHCAYSLQTPAYYGITGSGTAHTAESATRAVSEATETLNNFVSGSLDGRNVRIMVLTGKPGHEIVEYAKENNIELIIMGHSTTGIERVALGSVAGHVVKHSPVPVLVISPALLQK